MKEQRGSQSSVRQLHGPLGSRPCLPTRGPEHGVSTGTRSAERAGPGGRPPPAVSNFDAGGHDQENREQSARVLPPPPLLRVTTTASAVHLPQARPLTPGVEERSWSINTQDKAQRSGGADRARGPSQRTGKEQASSSPHTVPPREEPLSGDSRPGLFLAVAHGLHTLKTF